MKKIVFSILFITSAIVFSKPKNRSPNQSATRCETEALKIASLIEKISYKTSHQIEVKNILVEGLAFETYELKAPTSGNSYKVVTQTTKEIPCIIMSVNREQ